MPIGLWQIAKINILYSFKDDHVLNDSYWILQEYRSIFCNLALKCWKHLFGLWKSIVQLVAPDRRAIICYCYCYCYFLIVAVAAVAVLWWQCAWHFEWQPPKAIKLLADRRLNKCIQLNSHFDWLHSQACSTWCLMPDYKPVGVLDEIHCFFLLYSRPEHSLDKIVFY